MSQPRAPTSTSPKEHVPEDVEEFWDVIRPFREPELPEGVDQGVIARALQEGVDPRIVSRAQSLAEQDIREIRDITQILRDARSWRGIPDPGNRRGFLIQLQEDMAERRRRGLRPIPIRTSRLVIRPGESLDSFHVRCLQDDGLGDVDSEFDLSSQLHEPPVFHGDSTLRVSDIADQITRNRVAHNLRGQSQQSGAANMGNQDQPSGPAYMGQWLDQPNNTPTLGVSDPHPPRWNWNNLEPLTEREQIIRNHAFMDGYASREPQEQPLGAMARALQRLGLPCRVTHLGGRIIQLVFVRMSQRVWTSQYNGDELHITIEPEHE